MIVWIILAAVAVFVIAAVSIGAVTGSLARRPRRSVYDLDEAVEFVAERLLEDVTARLSFDDVRAVLGAHCDYLAEKGVASLATAEDIGTELLLVPDDEPLAWIIGRLESQGVDVGDADVAAVLAVEERYYRAIGAIGGEVEGPADPSSS
ncbi:MAG: hypothetical protein FJW94_01990 [Actinobacteria bacterium]|nr:hypothetical protein [Actinomycetota bacterium]